MSKHKPSCPTDGELERQVRELDDATVSVAFHKAILSVLTERDRQDAKWGEQNHSPEQWITILGEEFGELCQCVLHKKFGGDAAGGLRDELVQVAAVAVAMIECCDRNHWLGVVSKHKPSCPVDARHEVNYNEQYDAYYCDECRKWLEGVCDDPRCQFCVDRPVNPPEEEDVQ